MSGTSVHARTPARPSLVLFSCAKCSFTLWSPIGRLSCSFLGLYDDARYPGRSLLAYEDHLEDFAELPPDRLIQFTHDMQIAAKAIARATGAARVNYAILGNAESHLHAHLIPRVPGGDPVPNKSPWSHPEPVRELAASVRIRLVKRIGHELKVLLSQAAGLRIE